MQDGDLVAVAGSVVRAGELVRPPTQPFAQQAVDSQLPAAAGCGHRKVVVLVGSRRALEAVARTVGAGCRHTAPDHRLMS
jgi:hypothetical protein